MRKNYYLHIETFEQPLRFNHALLSDVDMMEFDNYRRWVNWRNHFVANCRLDGSWKVFVINARSIALKSLNPTAMGLSESITYYTLKEEKYMKTIKSYRVAKRILRQKNDSFEYRLQFKTQHGEGTSRWLDISSAMSLFTALSVSDFIELTIRGL